MFKILDERVKVSKKFDEVIERVKEIFNVKSDADVARALKIEPGTFSYARKKGNLPAVEILHAIQHKGVSIEWVFYGLGEPKITPKLKLGNEPDAPMGKIAVKMFPDISASAGYGCLNGDHCEFETIFVDRNLLPRTSSKQIEAIKVNGDSMSSTLNDGDMIFVDKLQHEVKNGKIFIIRMNDEIFVKRLYISPNGLIVKSDNPDYPQFNIKKDEIEILGQVIYTMEYHG